MSCEHEEQADEGTMPRRRLSSEIIQKWKDLTQLQNKADDHTICPECGEQIITCHCPQDLAQEILEGLEDIRRAGAVTWDD